MNYAEGSAVEAAVHVAAPPGRVWEPAGLPEVEWIDGPARLAEWRAGIDADLAAIAKRAQA